MSDRPHTAEDEAVEVPDEDDVMRPLEPEIAAVFDDFWSPIVAPAGEWNLDQVKRELHDYHAVMNGASKVYYEITRGRISKPHTSPEAVIAVHDEVCPGDEWDCPACDGSGDYEEVLGNGACPLCEGKGELSADRLKALALELAMTAGREAQQ